MLIYLFFGPGTILFGILVVVRGRLMLTQTREVRGIAARLWGIAIVALGCGNMRYWNAVVASLPG